MAKKKVQQSNEFNTVTTFSKLLAFIMFITFPFLGFYMGMKFQKGLDKPFMDDVVVAPTSTEQADKVCTMEAKLCPDGSYVARTGPNCSFAKCPEGK